MKFGTPSPGTVFGAVRDLPFISMNLQRAFVGLQFKDTTPSPHFGMWRRWANSVGRRFGGVGERSLRHIIGATRGNDGPKLLIVECGLYRRLGRYGQIRTNEMISGYGWARISYK